MKSLKVLKAPGRARGLPDRPRDLRNRRLKYVQGNIAAAIKEIAPATFKEEGFRKLAVEISRPRFNTSPPRLILTEKAFLVSSGK